MINVLSLVQEPECSFFFDVASILQYLYDISLTDNAVIIKKYVRFTWRSSICLGYISKQEQSNFKKKPTPFR